MKTQILIPSSGVIDLYDDLPISLNYSIADIRSPDKRDADYSKTIKAPGSTNNDRLLAHIFEIGTDRLFNPNKKTHAEIVVDTVSVMKGVLRLAKINSLANKRIEYEFEFKGRLDDLFASIKDALITDINWSDLNHTWNKTNIQNSWVATVGTGYVYPFIDYGIGTNVNTKEVIGFRPATYIKEIWDRIFSYAGFQYSSAFLNTDFFKRLIIPFYNEKFIRSKTEIQNNIFRAHRSTTNQPFNFSVFTFAFNPAANVIDTVIYNNDFTSPSSDAGGVWNTTTGKFTAAEAGIYTFNSSVSLHFEFNSIQSLYTQGYTRAVKNGIDNVAVSNIVQLTFAPGSPTSGEINNIYNSWTGFLAQGETIEIKLQFLINYTTPIAPPFPTGQNNYIKTHTDITSNCFINNSLDPSYNVGSNIVFGNAVPQNLKMQDFLMAIIKKFNLYFEYDKDTPNKIHIEPRDDYYTTTVQDWSELQDISKDAEIQPMAALDAKRYIFKDKPDNDWLNDKYQSSYDTIFTTVNDNGNRVTQIKDDTYGIRYKDIDNDFLQNDNVLESIFSPTPQYSDLASDRVYPRIIKVDQLTNAIMPVTSNPRLLYYSGLKTCQQWTFYTSSPNSPTTHTTYPYCGHIDDPINPTLDLCWGVPKEIYYQPPWNATYSNNNLYNRFYKRFIEEITDKDSSIVTAWFYLTPKAIAQVDFRHIYRFGFQNYRLNKIYDYNPVIPTVTKVEFIKTKDSAPFVYENILAIGGSGNTFTTAEPGPQIVPALGNPVGHITNPKGTVVEGPGNNVPVQSSGVIIVGPKNTVGDGRTNTILLASSGNTIINDDIIMLLSSGITTTGDKQLWIYNTLVTSGDIAKLTSWEGPCPNARTVAQMQAMATSGTINPCSEYLITDAYGSFGLLRIRGRTTTQLEPYGTLYTSGTIYEAGYRLTENEITQIRDVRYNNNIELQVSGGYTGILNFPLNNSNFHGNEISDISITVSDASKCQLSFNNLKNSIINLNDNGSSGFGAIMENCDVIDSEVNISGLSGGSFSNMSSCTIYNTLVTISKQSAISSCTFINSPTLVIPPGILHDFSDINGKMSTFRYSVTLTAGSPTIDLTDFWYLGIFDCITTGAESITQFANISWSHVIRFYGSATDTVTFVHDGVNIFCAGAANVVLNNSSQWVDFRFDTSSGVVAYEEMRSNY